MGKTYELPDVLKLWNKKDGSYVEIELQDGDKACDPGPGGRYVYGPAYVTYRIWFDGYAMHVDYRS